MLYFAYGSNLNQKQMRRRCPGCKFVTTGQLDGFHLYYGGQTDEWDNKAYANLIKSHNSAVWGAIYELSEADIKKLDGFENAPKDYIRKRLTIHTKNDVIKAYVYIGHRVKIGQPSSKYRRTIMQGARAKHLPKTYVAKWL